MEQSDSARERLREWLQRLGNATGSELTKGRAREYLAELSEWQLSGQEWEILRREALRRCRYLPTIAELYELKLELFRPVDQPGSPPVWELVYDDTGHAYARRPQRLAL